MATVMIYIKHCILSSLRTRPPAKLATLHETSPDGSCVCVCDGSRRRGFGPLQMVLGFLCVADPEGGDLGPSRWLLWLRVWRIPKAGIWALQVVLGFLCVADPEGGDLGPSRWFLCLCAWRIPKAGIRAPPDVLHFAMVLVPATPPPHKILEVTHK